MDVYMEMVGHIIAIATFVGAAFSYIVLRPLNIAISELREAIRDLREDIRNEAEIQRRFEVRLTQIAERAEAAHRRLDRINDVNAHV